MTGVTVMDDGMEMGAAFPGIGKISIPGLLSSTEGLTFEEELLVDVVSLLLLRLDELLDFFEPPSDSVKSKTMGDFLASTT